jgi:hypothetical protein
MMVLHARIVDISMKNLIIVRELVHYTTGREFHTTILYQENPNMRSDYHQIFSLLLVSRKY